MGRDGLTIVGSRRTRNCRDPPGNFSVDRQQFVAIYKDECFVQTCVPVVFNVDCGVHKADDGPQCTTQPLPAAATEWMRPTLSVMPTSRHCLQYLFDSVSNIEPSELSVDRPIGLLVVADHLHPCSLLATRRYACSAAVSQQDALSVVLRPSVRPSV